MRRLDESEDPRNLSGDDHQSTIVGDSNQTEREEYISPLTDAVTLASSKRTLMSETELECIAPDLQKIV